MRAMSSWYFSSTPIVSETVSGIERDLVEFGQRARPVDRLGDARHLEQVDLAQLLHEARRPRRDSARVAPRHLAADDLELARGVGIVDPVVEAAALQRVVDLAGAVGGDDDDRRLGGLDRAEFGDRHLEVGQDFQQERLEGLVGAVEFVDQEDRRAARLAAPAPAAPAGGSGSFSEKMSRSMPLAVDARPRPPPGGSRSSGAA